MQPSSRELWVALFAILAITAFYLVVVLILGGIPAASDFFGHTLGVVGFLLMLMTETLYTLRKRSRSARWGKTSTWLQFHIVTGLVGPYMVLLHSSWKFNGLAGMVLLMTGVIVVSGFIGRYIYTAIPRSADGLELESGEIQLQINALEAEINAKMDEPPRRAEGGLQFSPAAATSSSRRGGDASRNLTNRITRWNNQNKIDSRSRTENISLNKLIQRHKMLERQRSTLAQARRLMALWHTLHVPLGLALFAAAFIHIGAAIYYATLLR